MLETRMALSYFLESDSGEDSVGHFVRVESEVIGVVGWATKDMMRVDLEEPVYYRVLLNSGLKMDQIVFHAKA